MSDLNTPVYKRKCFLINLAYFVVIAAMVILVVKYALSALMPFVIAAISAAILRPVLDFFNQRLKFPRKPTGVVLALVFYLCIALVALVVVDRMLDTATSLLMALPGLWNDTLMPALEKIGIALGEKLAQADIELEFGAEELLSQLGTRITSLSAKLLGKVGGIAFSLPSMLISVIICIVSTLFMLFDWNKIRDFILIQMSDRGGDLARRITRQSGSTIRKFILSYGLIMVITFTELSIGLNIIGIRNAFMISALIAIFDIMPVVGCGGILIPWSIIGFIIGNTRIGVGIAILYLVITVIRNIIEPRIVGQQVGLHPLVTLMSMVIGSSIMGGVGLLGLPITLAVLNKMNADGVIHLYKTGREIPQTPLASKRSKSA